MHCMIPIMDSLNDGLELALKNESYPLSIRHGAARALFILNKYYTKTDAAHVARFAMSKSSICCNPETLLTV